MAQGHWAYSPKIKLLVFCSVLLGFFAFLTPLAAQHVGNAETVVGAVYGQSVTKKMVSGETLMFRQKIRTGVDGAAHLRFVDSSTLSLGARTDVVIDEFVYDPNRGLGEGLVNLLRGVMRFASPRRFKAFAVKTPVGTVGIRGTVFDLWVQGKRLEIAVHEGQVTFTGSGQIVTLQQGEVLQIASDGATTRPPRSSDAFSSQIATMVQRLQSEGAAITARSTPQSAALRLVMTLLHGEVVIAMLPALAPQHVARIQTLVRQQFYDGLSFFDVQDNFAAITGDPSGTGAGGSGQTLQAEFSTSPFTAGSVGMIHAPGQPDSADSQFFIALDDLPYLNGQFTKWGQVVSGMEHIQALARGRPPAQPDYIVSLRLQEPDG